MSLHSIWHAIQTGIAGVGAWLAANTTSIGIEHSDMTSDPWTVSEACLDNGANLVAAVCKFYGLSRPAWGKNVFGHKDFSATACQTKIVELTEQIEA